MDEAKKKKFDILVYDSEKVYGGWWRMQAIEAKSEEEAKEWAKSIYGEQVRVKELED